MFNEFVCAIQVYSRLLARVWRGDNSGALETKYPVANPSFAPEGHRRHTRHYSLCSAQKSVPMKS
jgi:hypothetical protein